MVSSTETVYTCFPDTDKQLALLTNELTENGLQQFKLFAFCSISVLVTLGCNSRLLADRAMVPDTSFQHSSAATIQHGASAAREDPNDPSLQERAWCPDAKGRQTTPYFYVKYRRELTSTWFDYEKENGTKVSHYLLIT
ncbi:unnamed protein product [Trichobilharzia regenti]|nr:unnamed protein product [Trichobilharzia regenti]